MGAKCMEQEGKIWHAKFLLAARIRILICFVSCVPSPLQPLTDSGFILSVSRLSTMFLVYGYVLE